MSTSADGAETRPEQNLSVSQLLHAAKKKLQDTGSVGWVTTTLNEAETDLERDALQVLSLVRSAKNTLLPINKLPAEVFVLIPDCWQDNDRDPNLIALTHVCRSWRDALASRASLWARSDFANVEKTRGYLERSKPFPLNIRLEEPLRTFRWSEALPLVVPHTSRLLRKFDLSRSRWLITSWCYSNATARTPIVDWAVYKTLHFMESLHALALIQSINRPFILSLNPAKNPSNIILCPNLEEIVFYVERPNQLYTNELLGMAEERVLRGAKLSVVTIVSTGELAPPKDVFQLRKRVSRLECKFYDAPPECDAIPEPFDVFGPRRTPNGSRGSRMLM